LHRKYEAFERRQRIREKEKLQFERHKMKSRIDLLKNMSATSWAAVVGAVLSRSSVVGLDDHGGGYDPWARGREKMKTEDVDWLRARLVKEGVEVIKRYDQLLPVERRCVRYCVELTPDYLNQQRRGHAALKLPSLLPCRLPHRSPRLHLYGPHVSLLCAIAHYLLGVCGNQRQLQGVLLHLHAI
jgi:hypothetical protein